MTLVVGLRSNDTVVLASDSQRTEGGLREERPKLFVSRNGIAWGTAGSIPVQQELHGLIDALDLAPAMGRVATKDALMTAFAEAHTRTLGDAAAEAPGGPLHGLFAWYSSEDRRTYLLRLLYGAPFELFPKYTAIGGPHLLAKFAFSRGEHLGYDSLPPGGVRMVAYDVVDDVIRASSGGVALPVQMAQVTSTAIAIVPEDELRAVADTVAAYREYQRDYLRREEPIARRPDTGIRP